MIILLGARRSARLGLAAALLLAAGTARAGRFVPPSIPEGETCLYQVYERAEDENQKESFVSPREEVQEVHQVITTFDKDGKKYYRFFRGERLSGGHWNYYTYVYRMEEPFRFVAFTKNVQSTTGRLVHRELTYFDDPGRPFPDDLNHFYSIPMTVRGMAFAPGLKNDLQIWFSSHFTPWKMNVIVEGKERVKVPAGEFACWRVRVEPDLKAIFLKWFWIARILKAWIPDFYYWFDQAPPHRMIKFEGRFGPVGFSPVQVQVLTATRSADAEDRDLLRRFAPGPNDLDFYKPPPPPKP